MASMASEWNVGVLYVYFWSVERAPVRPEKQQISYHMVSNNQQEKV